MFSYSNVGYTLLGQMIQEVSGLPYADYMQRRLSSRWAWNTAAWASRHGVRNARRTG